MTAREREFLPAEFPKDIPGTCYFLDSYRHEAVPEDAPQHQHIEHALKDLGIGPGLEEPSHDWSSDWNAHVQNVSGNNHKCKSCKNVHKKLFLYFTKIEVKTSASWFKDNFF